MEEQKLDSQYSLLENNSSNAQPVETSVSATTSRAFSIHNSTPGKFFKKFFCTPSNLTVKKKSRAGLVITPSYEEKLGISVRHRTATASSSAVPLRRSYSSGSRTDFSGAVISISKSTESEGTSTAATQKRINSRLRRSFSHNSTSSNSLNDFVMSTNSPQVARRLLVEEDINTIVQESHNKQQGMSKVETKGRGTSPIAGNPIEDSLLAATSSPERHNDLIFVAKSSSSSEAEDSLRENLVPRSDLNIAPELPRQNDQSHLGRRQIPMKTRGISIPTPAINRHTNFDEASSLGLVFSGPLKSVTESPVVKMNLLQRLSFEENGTNTSLRHLDEDDEAFLPDDFNKPLKFFSESEVQQMIRDAKETVIDEMVQEYDKKFDQLEQNYNESLMEHGLEWRREKEAEHNFLMARLNEEKSKTAQQHQELLRQSQMLEKYQHQVEDLERNHELIANGKCDDNIKVITNDDGVIAQELYISHLQEKITSMQEQLSELQKEECRSNEMVVELQSLRQAKNEAEKRTEELKTQLSLSLEGTSKEELNRQLLLTNRELDELRDRDVVGSNRDELVTLKGEYSTLERQLNDLTERLRVRTESNNDALNRLEGAENEIIHLKKELSQSTESVQKSSTELKLAMEEIEKLQRLRTQDDKEMEKLRSQLERVGEQYNAVLYSPQRTTSNTPLNSPCSQVDILRVDNDKVHEQLKAMGQVRMEVVMADSSFSATQFVSVAVIARY